MIEIVTDSTGYVPMAVAQPHNITMIPGHLIIGQVMHRDEINAPRQEFYERLVNMTDLSCASSPSPGTCVGPRALSIAAIIAKQE